MPVEKVPREKLLELLPRLTHVPAIAIAPGDVQEERKRKAAKALP